MFANNGSRATDHAISVGPWLNYVNPGGLVRETGPLRKVKYPVAPRIDPDTVNVLLVGRYIVGASQPCKVYQVVRSQKLR